MRGLKDEFLLPFSFTSLGGLRHGLEARKFHSPLHLNLSSGTENLNWFYWSCSAVTRTMLLL